MTQHYALFDQAGFPVAFFLDDVHGRPMRPVYGEPDGETGEAPILGEEPNPTCGIPVDAIPISAAQWLEFVQNNGRRRWFGGAIVEYEPPPPPLTQADYSAAIQAHLDAKASERQYDGIHSAIGYRDDPNPNFAAEALALFNWRSAVWTFSSTELAKVMAGERAQPTVAEFMSELEAACPFTWPMHRPAMLGGQLSSE